MPETALGFTSLKGAPSLLGRPWRIRALPEQFNAEELVNRFLRTRGLSEASDINAWLNYSLRDMSDPALLPDITHAAERILDGVGRGEKITVYGDYDVDGVTSSALLHLALQWMFGFELDVYIPHRLKEGYGLNSDAIKKIADAGTSLVITVDNGSSAQAEIDVANALGLDVIIVDHHQVSDPEPAAYAHLNPHRKGCEYPHKGLAAVGVAFMLLIELRRVAANSEIVTLNNRRIDQFMDLVALGTVADVAPLTDINRALVTYGLGQIRRGPRLGIDALCRVSGVDSHAINEGDLGFKLGPRVNAAGRLENAADGYNLLISEDPLFAELMANRIDKQNAERRTIQKRIEAEALSQAESVMAESSPEILILHGDDWHPGVVGIVASRVMEEYQLPVFCLALDGNIWKGSGRSVPGIHLKNLLSHCDAHLLRYGGHVAAAGVTLAKDALMAFKSAAQAHLHLVKTGHDEVSRFVDADVELTPHELTFERFERLSEAGPFGHENPLPKFLLRRIRARTKLMKGHHLKLYSMEHTEDYVEAIGWNLGHAESLFDDYVDLIFTARIESWRGRRRITLNLIDIRRSQGSLDET